MKDSHQLEYPTPKEIFGWRIYFLAFSATWASASFGYVSAFVGSTLDLGSFKRSFGLENATTAEATSLSSNLVATFQAGGFFGCIACYFLAEYFGRKRVIIMTGIVYILGVIPELVGSIGAFYAGRVLTGCSIGGSSLLVPIYITECAPAAIRGRLVGMFEVQLCVFLVVGFWVTYAVNQGISDTLDEQWRIPVAIQFIPSGLLVITMLCQIESPRWLISKNQVDAGIKALSWVRNLPVDHEYVQQEARDIQRAINYESEKMGGHASFKQNLREACQCGIRNRILVGMGLMCFQNLESVNALNYFSPTIVKSIGFQGTSINLLATGIYGIVKTCTTLFTMFFLIDRVGRRVLLMFGGASASIAMFYLAAYTNLSGSFDHINPINGGARAALAMIYLLAIFYGCSWSGIPWVYSAEILPNRVRAFGNMLVVCSQWLSQFAIIYAVPYMISDLKYGTFIFFGIFSIMASLFAYLFVPETKGIQLEDMEILFGADAPLFASQAMATYKSAHEGGLTSLGVEEAREKSDVTRLENLQKPREDNEKINIA